jgi:hypothetical protein
MIHLIHTLEKKSYLKVSFRNEETLTREALVSRETVLFHTFLKTKGNFVLRSHNF